MSFHCTSSDSKVRRFNVSVPRLSRDVNVQVVVGGEGKGGGTGSDPLTLKVLSVQFIHFRTMCSPYNHIMKLIYYCSRLRFYLRYYCYGRVLLLSFGAPT